MTTTDQIKSCCAAAYSSDIVTLLLGDSYHPGGLALTRHLASYLNLTADAWALDVACGRGTTALLLATEHRARVDGVDLSTANVALARGAAAAAGLPDRVAFTVGDAERLPYPDATVDAVVCECALCTFPDKPTAAAEFARVLRPGGRAGITDVVSHPNRLPAELTGIGAWIACVADARPLPAYADLLTNAGLRVMHTERHDTAMTRMIDQIEARLGVVRMTSRHRAEALGVDLDRAGPILAAARAAVADGTLGYGLLVAEKPA
jgi:ubiquinone/menaquinone biosynthesis C-methylase UbiE